MTWFIVAFVTAAVFSGEVHRFTTERHYATEAACEAAISDETGELADELEADGVERPIHIVASCEMDPKAGEPA